MSPEEQRAEMQEPYWYEEQGVEQWCAGGEGKGYFGKALCSVSDGMLVEC